ncbi:hypothetical protein F4861DRAFT_549768 [Xylaria intraflava]|nr:hypothetical protein F4861DRAFT_549768 [Xylaria intraflava]
MDDPAPVVEDILDGPPPTAWRDFKHPRLRQFPAHETRIRWLECLGLGQDGMVFKAAIGNHNPVAVKVFWDAERPRDPRQIWSFEEEARTAATLEKVKWVIESDNSIKINKAPQTRKNACYNLYLLSDQGRRHPATDWGPTDPPRDDLPPFPPLPTCYGWMKLPHRRLPRLSRWTSMPMEVNEPDWYLLLGDCPFRPHNWHGGRLIDMNDISIPFPKGRGWWKWRYEPKAEKILVLDPPATDPPTIARDPRIRGFRAGRAF